MLFPALLGVCSFLLCLLVTPPVRDLAVRLRWVDTPDCDRKRHAVAVPRIGGIPIVLAYGGSFAVLLFLKDSDLGPLWPFFWHARALLPAAVAVFIVGLLDDLIGLKPSQKLVGQTTAAILACWTGLYMGGADGILQGKLWLFPLLVVWLVGCSNAFNLIDGADGVATGIGLLGTLAMLMAGVLHQDRGLVLAMAPLAGALLGFLRFNFSPASIFLGDCGSLWIGFVLGYYSIVWAQESGTVLGAIAPLMALSIPLLDTALAIVRRFIGGKPIFRPDHSHIHHRLLDRGLTPRRMALLLYAVGVIAAFLALVQSTSRGSIAAGAFFLFCVAGWYGIKYLHYRELDAAARLILRGDLRSQVQSELSLDKDVQALRAVHDPEECWQVIRTVARDFGFIQVSLRISGKRYREQLSHGEPGQWALRIPLGGSDCVSLTHQCETTAIPVARLADVLQRILTAKAAEFALCAPAYGLRRRRARSQVATNTT